MLKIPFKNYYSGLFYSRSTVKRVNSLLKKILQTINAAGSCLDLPKVDLLASGASLLWPRSGRPRAAKSREVPRHIKSDDGLLESLGHAGSPCFLSFCYLCCIV